MLELFDPIRWNRTERNFTRRPSHGNPRRRYGVKHPYSRRFPLSPPVEDTTRQNTQQLRTHWNRLRQYGKAAYNLTAAPCDYSQASGIRREDGRQWGARATKSPNSLILAAAAAAHCSAYVDTSSLRRTWEIRLNSANDSAVEAVQNVRKRKRHQGTPRARRASVNTDRVEGSYKGKTYDAIASGTYRRDYRGGNGRSGDGRDVTMRRHGQQPSSSSSSSSSSNEIVCGKAKAARAQEENCRRRRGGRIKGPRRAPGV